MASKTSGMGSKKRSYYAAFKLEVVKYAEEYSKAKAARVYKVDRRRIVEWCQSKEKLLTCPTDRLRMSGGGKKPLMAEVEVELEGWMRERREEGQKVTMKMLMAEAGKRAKERGIGFKGSRGWLYNFTKRHDIKFRGALTATEGPIKQSLRSASTSDGAVEGMHVSQPENASMSDGAKEGIHVSQPENEVQIQEQEEEVYSTQDQSGTSQVQRLVMDAIQTFEQQGMTGVSDAAESGTVQEVAVASQKKKDRSQSLPPQRQKRPSRRRSRSQSSLSQDVRDSLTTEKQNPSQGISQKKSTRSKGDNASRKQNKTPTDSQNSSKPQQKRNAPQPQHSSDKSQIQNNPPDKSDKSQKPKEPQDKAQNRSKKSKSQRHQDGPDLIVEILPVKPPSGDIAPPPAIAESTSTMDITPTPELLAPQPPQDTAMKQWQESRAQDTFVVVVDKMDDT